MSIQVIRDRASKMRHVVHVRQHSFSVDEPAGNGGEDLGITPHETYDSEERAEDRHRSERHIF